MPICIRCGRPTDPDAEYCPACTDDRQFRYGQSEPEHAALPSYEFRGPDPRYADPPVTATAAPASRLSDLGAGGDARRRRLPPDRDRGDPAREPWHAADTVRGGRRIALTASIAVLVIAAAVATLVVREHGGGTHKSASGHTHLTSKPPSRASGSSARAAVAGLLAVSPAAAGAPHEAPVVAVLNRYFRAINSHAYSAYEQLFSPAQRGGLSAATFLAGYGTTHDSAITLQSISALGASQLVALVTFTSHQQPAASPTHSTCTAWRISLYLVRHGRRYLLAAPPPGYQATYRSCS